MALITAKDLTLGYEGNVVAKHIDLTVSQGDYLCIVGENGSGKTTLMKTILGLKAPMEGEILFGEGLKQEQIGYLPQQSLAQRDFPATAWEIVLSGCLNRMGKKFFYGKNEKRLAEKNMERMGIKAYKDRCYRELSGGQQQRVLLARALCATEKILLLDEPVSGLDPKAASEMYELIRQLNEGGVTIIMISHDVDSALTYASHVLHMGDDIFFGTREEYSDYQGKREVIA
jgi:zinc transport system ATP-binding protein